MAEDLLRNAENFNIAFGNVVLMNYANNSEESSEYNMTIQRDNISTLVPHLYVYSKPNMQLAMKLMLRHFNTLCPIFVSFFLRGQSLLLY